MLVLSRKKNEAVVIDHGRIEVTVVEIRGDKVRLGFDAARDIVIHRNEVEAAIRRDLAAESYAALSQAPSDAAPAAAAQPPQPDDGVAAAGEDDFCPGYWRAVRLSDGERVIVWRYRDAAGRERAACPRTAGAGPGRFQFLAWVSAAVATDVDIDNVGE